MRSAECGERSAEGQNNAVAVRAGSGSQPSALSPQPPRGVTLVELLITITIISILAGLILGVASLAGEKARENQTRHVVQRMHQLLMEHYDSYKTRRVRLSEAISNNYGTGIIDKLPSLSDAQKGRLRAEARLYAMREMMLMEIPDRWSDIYLADVNASLKGEPVYLAGSDGKPARTALANVYLRRLNAIASAPDFPGTDKLIENQGAECLYLVITLATGDGEARGLFAENSIGDTDDDGALEFLDGWGNPIGFLRWAPGFDSLIQTDANQFTVSTGQPPEGNQEWVQAAAGDHDPFDMFRIDPAAYRLVPLIFSAGGDETFGIWQIETFVTWVQVNPAAGRLANNNQLPRLSPYWRASGTENSVSVEGYLGTPDVEGATDNIHNHLLGLRGRP
jgi:prepilin-type N-terminal cleavage/methylation domain-containing protein